MLLLHLLIISLDLLVRFRSRVFDVWFVLDWLWMNLNAQYDLFTQFTVFSRYVWREHQAPNPLGLLTLENSSFGLQAYTNYHHPINLVSCRFRMSSFLTVEGYQNAPMHFHTRQRFTWEDDHFDSALLCSLILNG